jgi:hypothetical protein
MKKRDDIISRFFFLLVCLSFVIVPVCIMSCGTKSADDGNGSIYQGPDPDLYWCFSSNLISGNTITDVMGSYDGTMNAGVTTGGSGQVDESVSLDGSTGYITAAPPKENSLTLSLWINPTSIPADFYQIYCQGLGPAGWTGCNLSLRSTQLVRISLYDQGTTYHYIETNGTVDTGTWTHIAATVNIAGGNAEIAIYSNGVFQVSDSFTATSINYGVNDLCLGMNTWDSNRFFEGSIDEFVLFLNEILSDDDIKALYDSGVAGEPIVEHD